MKYLIFLITAMGVVPLGYILTLNRKFMHYAFFAVSLPVMMFNQVSINFFSHETYRGTSRGMEVSLIYLIAFAMLIGISLSSLVESTFFSPQTLLTYWGMLGMLRSARILRYVDERPSL